MAKKTINFSKFIKHNSGRKMYIITHSSIHIIESTDNIQIDDEFICNHTKRWGCKTSYIADVLVSATGADYLKLEIIQK